MDVKKPVVLYPGGPCVRLEAGGEVVFINAGLVRVGSAVGHTPVSAGSKEQQVDSKFLV